MKLLFLYTLASLAGCSSTADTTADGRAAERAAITESELRRWGTGRFEVVSVKLGAEHAVELRDDFSFPTRLYEMPFDATVRFTAAVVVYVSDDVFTEVGKPGWSLAGIDDAIELMSVFQPGSHPVGEATSVHAAAVFDRLEPGFRFRAFDHVR